MTRIDPNKLIQKRRTKEELLTALQQFIHRKQMLCVPPEVSDPDIVLMDAIRELVDLRARFEGMAKYVGGPPGSSVLSPEQYEAVEAVKYRMVQDLLARSEAFYGQHPELRLSWNFECSATVSEEEKALELTAEEQYAIDAVNALRSLHTAIGRAVEDATSIADSLIQQGPGQFELARATTCLQEGHHYLGEALIEVGRKLPRLKGNGEAHGKS